jgi:hypothetical protein
MKLGMYIVAPKPITKAYFINTTHQSVCLRVYGLKFARKRLGRHVPMATNTSDNIKLIGRVIFMRSVYPLVVARRRFGKHVPTTTRNYWRRRFLWRPCRIKGK